MKKIITASAAVALALALISPAAAFAEEGGDTVSAPLTTEQEAQGTESPDTLPEPVSEAQEPAPVVEESVPEEAPAPVEDSTLTEEGQPDFICDEDTDGWLEKVDNSGEGNTVTVTAPEGFLIDRYCVKAGTTKHIIEVTPAASVEVDHPEKDSVSHYQIHVVPVPEEDPDPRFVPCEVTGSQHFTSLEGWDFTQSSGDGSASWAIVENGLAVSTLSEGHRKVAGYLPVSFPLSHYGTFDIDWTGTTPPPGGQLLVDLDGDGTPTGYLVIEDAYNGEWWLSANWGNDVDPADLPVTAVGGGGADWATPQEFLNAFPDANVLAIGFSLGSGVTGSGTINSITAGCKVYTFDLPDPEPLPATLTAPQWTDQCGTDNDEGALPVPTEGIEYTWLSDDTESPDYWTVRAYVAEGYVLTGLPEGWTSVGEGAYDYVIPMSAEACPVEEPEPTPTPTPTPTPAKTATPSALAATGGPDTSLFIGGGVLALLLGAVALVGARLRRR